MLAANFGSSGNSFLQLLCSIAVFVAILFVAFIVTKWIGNYQQIQMKNNNMEVLETMRIMNGKCIQIVRIAEEYIVIAVCKDTVTFLTKLDADSIEELRNNISEEKESFQDVLNKFRLKKK